MKTLVEGYKYELANFEGEGVQTIQFIEKYREGDELVAVNDGTTNEEVLAMLIDRMEVLRQKMPSRETSIEAPRGIDVA